MRGEGGEWQAERVKMREDVRGGLGLDQDVSMGIIFDKYVLQTHGLYRMTGDRTLSKAEKTKPDYSYGLSKMHRKHCHAPSFSVGGGGGTSYLLTGGVRKEGGRLSLSHNRSLYVRRWREGDPTMHEDRGEEKKKEARREGGGELLDE